MTLQRLKRATYDRHVALESQSTLLDPSLSLESYRDCLLRFYGFYEPLEACLMGGYEAVMARVTYAERRKTPQLLADLVALGLEPEQLAQAPRCRQLPNLSSASRRFGCLYVIEGATLGGRIVTRHLQERLGVTLQSGGSFFAGYGEKTGSRWKAFGDQLSDFAARSGSEDEMVAGAIETFDTLGCWLFPINPTGTLSHESARSR